MTNRLASSRDVLIQSETLDQALKFYRDTMGLPVTHQSDGLLGFEAGAFQLFVERGPAFGPVFEFVVSDFEAAKQRLIAAGCRVEKDEPAFPRCYLRDPFGLIFNIAEKGPSGG